MISTLKYFLDQLKKTFIRFPECVALSFLLGLYSSYLIQVDSPDRFYLVLLLTQFMGLPVFVFLTFNFQKWGYVSLKSTLGRLVIGISILTLFFIYLYYGLSDRMFFLQFFHLALIVHLLVSLGGPKPSNELEFWNFNRDFFLRALLSFFYSLVLFIGLCIFYAAINLLLGINLPKNIYAQSFVFIFTSFLTVHFLAGSPTLDTLTSKKYPYSLLVFVKYLLIPLTTLYVLILYIYLGKIIVTGDWTKTYVAWLISGVSILGVFNLLLVSPLERDPNETWITKYKKFFYMSLIPLLGMLFWSLYQRISEFGLTEPRLILLYLGLTLLLISIYFLKTNRTSIDVIPKTLLFVSVLGFIFPLNIYQNSRWSQQKKLEKLMIKHQGSLNPETANKFQKLTPAENESAVNIIRYLARHHGLDSLNPTISKEKTEALKLENTSMFFSESKLSSLFGILKLKTYRHTDNRIYLSTERGTQKIEFKNIKLYKFSFHNNRKYGKKINITNNDKKELSIEFSKGQNEIIVVELLQQAQTKIRFNISELLKIKKNSDFKNFNLLFDNEKKHQIHFTELNTNEGQLIHLEAYLLLK